MLYELHNCRNKKAIDHAMSFVITLLDIPDHVYINVNFRRKWDGISMGGCIDMENDGEYHYFEIDINNKQPLQEIIATLFHEMKHVEQTATGRLDQTMWEGVSYKDAPYDDRPWEKEAYNFESKCISRYKAEY
jgi:hypothetical protein